MSNLISFPATAGSQRIDPNTAALNYTSRMAKKFEAYVLNNDIIDLGLKIEEDELGHMFYTDPSTRSAFFTFCAGYNLGSTDPR